MYSLYYYEGSISRIRARLAPHISRDTYTMSARIAPETTHEELATFLKEHHPALVVLLPDDTDADDLFKAGKIRSCPLCRLDRNVL